MQALNSIVAVLIAAAALGCQSSPHERMLGTWQSDRSATLEELSNHPSITSMQRDLLDQILGRLVVEYREHSAISKLDGWSGSWQYDVVGEGPNYVDLRGFDERSAQVKRIWVEGDRMWVHVEGMGFNEYYSRMPD
jgi:hypothetical protein